PVDPWPRAGVRGPDWSRGPCLCQSSRPLPSSWASGHVSSASEHVKDRVSGGRAAALPSSHTDWHPWCPAPLSVLSRLLPPAQDPLGGRRRRAQPRLASRVKEGVPAPAGRWGDGAGCCPHQQPPPGAPSALRLAPSPCTWQGHRLPQRGGRGQLLLGAKPRGAQSHIPRCRPCPPSTSILLSTSGNAALYAPPASSLSPARSSLGCRVEETASLPFAILTLVNAPYKRGFYCGDDSIRYPYRPDTITHGLMAGVTITATIILVSAGEAYLVYTDRLYSRSDFNNYVAAVYKVLGTFLFGAAVSQSLTDLAKYMIGRLRPNFLAVCDPDWSRVNCSMYVQVERVCRGNPANVTESRLSFYSGHSSFGMYCMVFLALYVQARLCWKWARLLRPTVQVFLLAFALYVGYTRVSDHKHHWSDVLVGLLQGALVAGLTVRYISDFFKSRPPQRCLEEEELGRKPSLSLTLTLGEADRNHYGYPVSSS
uniref:Phospholipid phosphatase 2 n=1 Tax=Ursus maritimus TaxID=29073 RepID=A0A452TF48_URSMA